MLWSVGGVRSAMERRIPPGRDTAVDRSDGAASAEAPLGPLDDEYTRRLLATLDGEPLPAAALVDRCEMSRATVYRRLDRLEEAGLVTSRLRYDPDGHHRHEFELGVDRVVRTADG
jgi:DNA-binding transcriptional ArsR family regulator